MTTFPIFFPSYPDVCTGIIRNEHFNVPNRTGLVWISRTKNKKEMQKGSYEQETVIMNTFSILFC